MQARFRFPLMALAFVALLAAAWSGLLRLGWQVPALQPALAMAHGPLFVCGFLGTLIGLERAVALAYRWAYAAPALTGLGALLLIVGVPGLAGPLLITLGSLLVVGIFFVVIRRQPALFTVIMGMGALAWLVGNLLWLTGQPLFRVVFWWVGFLVLTIAGERLELGRLLRHARGVQVAFGLIIALLVAGLVVAGLNFAAGVRLTGVALVGLALWLARYDIARRTIRRAGLTRFIAVCMLSGYLWLGVGGLIGLIYGGVPAGPIYDALLHALFVGFVFAMIFGHAPIIFPAVLGIQMAFLPVFYVHLGLLHLSLLVRVVGDLVGWVALRQWGGLLNVVALGLFLVNTLVAVRLARSTATRAHGLPAFDQQRGDV